MYQSQGLLSQQGQSKDMPPRFIKKGQLNADEVRVPDQWEWGRVENAQ